MGVGDVFSVSRNAVSDSRELRIDAHYHRLSRKVEALRRGIKRGVSLSIPHVSAVENGKNVARSAYDMTSDNPDFVYVSVAGLSQFALQVDRCVGLRNPDEYAYSFRLSDALVKPTDVLVTRSGTPGIAWAMTGNGDSGPKLIPSGFVIRINCEGSSVSSAYAAAILNHPAWRVWTSSLAAGKRQRNLSQEHLSQVQIPTVSPSEERMIEEEYARSLEEIDALLADEIDICAIADAAIKESGAFEPRKLSFASVTFDRLTVSRILASQTLRIDARYHRSDVREALSAINTMESVELGMLLEHDLIKNSQPEILQVEDEESSARVVATSTIQGGQVVDELMKFTTDSEIERAGESKLELGDLLITMDGEGSIGKAAVYESQDEAIPDSHVGILRLKSPSKAWAIACFLNSSLGQAQFYVATTGATGQTQVSKGDLLRLQIPISVLEKSSTIETRYRAGLRTYELPTRRTRRAICRSAVKNTETLLRSGALDESCTTWLSSTLTEEAMFSLLSNLLPSMF